MNLHIPDNIKASVPANLLLEGNNAVTVRINAADHDIEQCKAYYAGRLFNFEFEDDLFLEPGIMQQLTGMRIKIGASDKIFEIGKNLKLYKNAISVFAALAYPDLVKKINYLTAFGFQVHIDTTTLPAADSVLENALEFYLHNPLLKTPIEPFHSLLKNLGRGSGYNLWDTEYEKVSSHIYIDGSNNISLSRRWLDQGQAYGKVNDGWEKLSASPLFSKLKHFNEELFRQKSPCIFCKHMDICRGFLKAANKEWPCEPWIHAFDILRNEVSRAQDLIRNMDEGIK